MVRLVKQPNWPTNLGVQQFIHSLELEIKLCCESGVILQILLQILKKIP